MNYSLSIQENFDLTNYNTMGLAAKARYFVSVKSVNQLKEIFNNPDFKDLSKFIMGGGSNVLFIRDFSGLLIHTALKGINIAEENEDEILLSVGAGENWHDLVLYCTDNGWGGIENLA
ncbi:MAG: FAD-binding protein, partial [Balneolaceae bacterium]